jgi:hypothetical protein
LPGRRIQALTFILILSLSACDRSGLPPGKAAPAESASTPSMPLPGTVTPLVTNDDPTIPQNVENPFQVSIRNCYLVDSEIDPIGAPASREKGIQMVITGSLRNNSDRIIHRAGVYSKLIVYFGKNARFEKFSGGLGFEPPVTSSNPWRPGAWRDFEIVGRTFDPIYREYDPKGLTGILSLEAKDPLGFSFAQDIAKMKPRWDTLFGAVVDQTVPVPEKQSVTYGPNNTKIEIKAGEMVKLVAQQGGGYLVQAEGRLAGWIPSQSLDIRQYEGMYPEIPARTFPMVATSEGHFEFTVTEYRYQPTVPGLPAESGGYMSVFVKVKSLTKNPQAFHPNFFWIDEGSGRYSTAIEKTKDIPDALEANLKMTLGSEASGWVFFPHHVNGWPFALILQWSKTAPPAHILLLPAVARENARKSPPLPEES